MVGGAVGGRGKDDDVPSRPGAGPGVADAVSCRGGSDANLAVQGLGASEGAVMSRHRRCQSRHRQVQGPLLAVCLDEAFDKRIDVARLR